jgi:competence protein ComEC
MTVSLPSFLRSTIASLWSLTAAQSLHVVSCTLLVLFLVGVFMGSFVFGSTTYAGITLLTFTGCISLLFWFLRRKLFALSCLFLIIGAGYFLWRTQQIYSQAVLPADAGAESSVIVQKVVVRDATQQVFARLLPPHRGTVALTLQPYPRIMYGDQLLVRGVFQAPEEKMRGYFLKDGVVAQAPLGVSVVVAAHNQGSPVKAALLRLRSAIQDRLAEFLEPESATLMTGLVLGKSGGFSRAFTEKLKETGTTHLVALSGYNISAILRWLLFILVFIMHRRYALWVSVVAMIAFVVMTGAEASVVRAACMASIVLLAERTQRTYVVYSALLCTATAMVAWNPAIAVFDIGFQLSFGALLGIVYLEPALRTFCRVGADAGLLHWKQHALATTAAQLAVLPITAHAFGFFSPLSIITNILLLEAIPYTMACGVLIVITSLFSKTLAFLVAVPAQLLLAYELGVINFFAGLPGGVHFSVMPLGIWVGYYGLLILFIIRYYPKVDSPQ